MLGVGLLNMEKPASSTQSMRLLANTGLMWAGTRIQARVLEESCPQEEGDEDNYQEHCIMTSFHMLLHPQNYGCQKRKEFLLSNDLYFGVCSIPTYPVKWLYWCHPVLCITVLLNYATHSTTRLIQIWKLHLGPVRKPWWVEEAFNYTSPRFCIFTKNFQIPVNQKE